MDEACLKVQLASEWKHRVLWYSDNHKSINPGSLNNPNMQVGWDLFLFRANLTVLIIIATIY